MFVFHQRDFYHGSRQVFQLTLNYHSRLWLQLETYYFEPNMLLTPKIIAVKIVGKNELRWPSLCQVSCKFFASQVSLCRRNESHKNGLPAKYGVKSRILCFFREPFLQDSTRIREEKKANVHLPYVKKKLSILEWPPLKGAWLDSAFTSHDFSCLVFAQYSISKHLSNFTCSEWWLMRADLSVTWNYSFHKKKRQKYVKQYQTLF